MLKSKHRLVLQRVVVGSMLVAILVFGLARYFRVEEAAKRKASATYDSDLHDKSGLRTTVAEEQGSPVTYAEQVKFDLNRTKRLLMAENEDQAIKILDSIMSRTASLKDGAPDKDVAESQKIYDRVAQIEQKLFTGNNDDAVKGIVELRDSLEAQSINQ